MLNFYGIEWRYAKNNSHYWRFNGGIGHNLPQEAPQAFAEAVIEVDGY
jgi:hypothetical protein